MSQDKKYLFQDRNIEIKWRITKGLQQDNRSSQQQVTYELIPARQDEDVGVGPGIGGTIKFNNGYDFLAYQNETGQWLIHLGNNQWVPLEQKVQEFQQQLPQLIPLQNQQNQNNDEEVLQVEVSDYNNINEFRGHISEKDFESQTKELGELKDLQTEIEEHIQNIFDKNSPVQLNITNYGAQLQVKLQLYKGKKPMDFVINIQLNLVEQNKEDKDKIKKEIELNKQNQRMDNIEKELQNFQQSSQVHIQQELGKQKTELQSQLQQVQSTLQSHLQQSSTAHDSQVNQLRQEINSLKTELQQQCQQLIQQQHNQFKKISINHMNQVQQDIYLTQKLTGQVEFELSVVDDETEFQVGIIADGDLQNIEKKNKSYYVVLPDGKFTRGTTEFGKLLTYNLQVEDKLGLRVDTNKHQIQLVINDYPFPPIRISEGLEEFSFIIKCSTELSQFAGDTSTQM